MNKSSIYIVLSLLVGILLGFVFFGTLEDKTHTIHEHTSESSEANNKWTCSMHPQIIKNEPGDCPICGMELIPLTTNHEGLTAQQFKLTKHAEALANIETTVITGANDLNSSLKLSGTIKENADEVSIQPAHFNGRIEQLYVTSVGQHVSKGQLVASIYSPELISAQQELITAYKLREQQPELYKAVKGKFKNWMINGKQLQEVEQTGNVITKFNLYAHISGTVTEINVNEGDHIMDGKPIFKVANLNTVWAVFDAYENQISNLKEGQELVITSKAYPNDKISAKISFIDPVLNNDTRTVQVRSVVKNTDKKYKPGMFVAGQLQTGTGENQNYIAIPASSVLWTGTRSVVYVRVHADAPIFEMREITLGEKRNDIYQVIEGLNVGDEVVTNGTFTLDAAAQLQGKASMMNKKDEKLTNQSNDASLVSQNKRIEVSEVLKNEIVRVLDAYIALKDALVDDDAVQAKTEAEFMKQFVLQIKKESVKDNEKAKTKLKTIQELLLKDLGEIAQSKSLKQVRLHFVDLSLQMKNLIEIFGVNKKVYVQFCPMANHNSGALWLSFNQKIRNPYFGRDMLECGEIDKTIK